MKKNIGRDNKFNIIWIPLWKCNFKCVYCQGWRNTNGLEFQPFNIIKEVFDRFFDKICEYKAKDDFIDFVITGGEPTIYPDIYKIVEYLLGKTDRICICSNLSFDVKEFLKMNFPEDKVNISATYHSSCMNIENFINNLMPLKKYMKEESVMFVADNDNLKKQKEMVSKINAFGIKVNPLCLKYMGQQYKDMQDGQKCGSLDILNSDEEKEIVKSIRQEQKINVSDYESADESPFGKKCLAGYKYIQIFPNGNIRKCTLDMDFLGNIFDGDIKLYKSPEVCRQKICTHQYDNIIE